MAGNEDEARARGRDTEGTHVNDDTHVRSEEIDSCTGVHSARHGAPRWPHRGRSGDHHPDAGLCRGVSDAELRHEQWRRYEYNQLQNGTTLAPFMLFNGTAISPTAGDTISVACTGLSPASDSSLLTGVTSPLAAFVDKFSTAGTYGLNMFLGGVPTFAPTDNGPSRTTAANNGSLGASSGSWKPPTECRRLRRCHHALPRRLPHRILQRDGSPGRPPVRVHPLIGCVASGTCAGTTGLYETVTTTAAYTARPRISPSRD